MHCLPLIKFPKKERIKYHPDFVCFAINQSNRNILVVRDSLVSTFEKQQQLTSLKNHNSKTSRLHLNYQHFNEE